MIEFATATPAGCLIITEKGESRSVVYGSDYQTGSTHRPARPANVPADNWVAASFIILADSDERIITSAIKSLADDGIVGNKMTADGPKARLSTSKLALRIQRIERARQNMTSAPKSHSEHYDGTDLKPFLREEYPQTAEQKSEAFTAMRGTRIHGPRCRTHGMEYHTLSQAAHTRIRATQEYETPRVWYAADANVEWKYPE